MPLSISHSTSLTPAHDLVYFCGSGGANQDDVELKLSLRSAWDNFRDLSRVWIIGQRPSWLSAAAIYLPFPDSYSACKDANLIQKLLYLATAECCRELSEEFLLCSDDHYFLNPVQWSDCRPYHNGPCPTDPGKHNGWMKRVANTGRLAQQRDQEALATDCHVPYPIKKSLTPELLRYPYAQGRGCTVFTLYYAATGYQRNRAVEINTARVRADLRGNISLKAARAKLDRGNFFCLTDNTSIQRPEIRALLEARFPDASPYEI
jgi:hypothetical protein